VGANIAEAWQKRKYTAHFVSKLTDSDSEQAETQHWLRTAYSCKYINNKVFVSLLDECKHIGSMLGKMMQDAEHWCYRIK